MLYQLFKLGLLLVAGILVYNYFFGSNSERENSRKIFGQLREVATSTVALVKSEKEKFDHGKYDKALNQLGGVYKGLREQAKNLDSGVLSRLDELEQRKAKLQGDLNQLEQDETAPPPAKPGKKTLLRHDATSQADREAELEERRAELQRQLDRLAQDSQQLTREAQSGIEK